jgi:hypothetical protein
MANYLENIQEILEAEVDLSLNIDTNTTDIFIYIVNLLRMKYQNDNRFEQYFNDEQYLLDLYDSRNESNINDENIYEENLKKIIDLFLIKFGFFPNILIQNFFCDSVPLSIQENVLNYFINKCLNNNLYDNMIINLKLLFTMTSDWEPKMLITGYLNVIKYLNEDILKDLKTELLLNLENANSDFELTELIFDIILNDVIYWCETYDNFFNLLKRICLNIIITQNSFYFEDFLRKYFSVLFSKFRINLITIFYDEYNIQNKENITNQFKEVINYYYEFCNSNNYHEISNNYSFFTISSQDVEEECPICSEEFKIFSKINVCGHKFCKECIDNFVILNFLNREIIDCPYCRAEIFKCLKITEENSYFKILFESIKLNNLFLDDLFFEKYENNKIKIIDTVHNKSFICNDLV